MRPYTPPTSVRFDLENPFSLQQGDRVFLGVNSQGKPASYCSAIYSAIQEAGYFPIFGLGLPDEPNLTLIETSADFGRSSVYVQLLDEAATARDSATWVVDAVLSAYDRGIPTFVYFLHSSQVEEFKELVGNSDATSTIEFRICSSPEEAGMQVKSDLAALAQR